MKNIFISIFCISISASLGAQSTSEFKPQKHSFYLEKLTSSKDSEYVRVLKKYDSYIKTHSGDYLIQIERCRFIDNAYSDGEYNEKYDEAEECRDQLIKDFPKIPEVQLYQAEFIWGDSVIPFCNRLLKDYEVNKKQWPAGKIWSIYDKLAQSYATEKEYKKAIYYTELELEQNDTLDLSLFLANQYKALKDDKKAIELLTSKIDSSNSGWELNQKGKILLELGKPDKAILAFRLAQKDTDSYLDAASLAQALIDNGLYREARKYLVKAREVTYYKTDADRKLFEYDLKYGRKDSALSSYIKLVEPSFWNDPVGINRIRLFLNAPLLKWRAIDLLRLLNGLLFIITLLLLPYLWILPIYHLGNYFKNKGTLFPESPFRWGLRHLWLASSFLLLIDFGGTLIFNFGVLPISGDTDLEKVSASLANFTIFHALGLSILTILISRISDINILWGQIWDKKRSILTGIGLAFILKFCLALYLRLYVTLGGDASDSITFLALREDILSVNKYFHPITGFFLVVIFAPVYEEILFRGVFLSGCEKYMKFFLANCLQALAFALLHMDWKLVPFFFVFGFLAGYYRRKSQSLAPGISMHVTNNFAAFLVYMF